MKTNHTRISVLLALTILLSLCFSFSVSAEQEGLSVTDSTTTFRHFDYTLDENNHIKTADKNKIVDTDFKTKVIESKYLKVTLLPDFGGRILSIVYKPTGHELLYQNPVGTPYGIGEGNFYYNWLMVYGGIFPTFPEPEHGKTWCLPWEYKVLEQSSDKITVEMSFTDNIAPTDPSLIEKFSSGKTGIKCTSTVTVYKDKSYVDLGVKLVNGKDESVNYEYWTCTTLAPGSVPGKTLAPKNSEMVVPISKVEVKSDWWSWMATVDKPAEDGKGYAYDKLSSFANWKDMGIAYASPSIEKDWWGVINHENEEGILRIADNKKYTPGLKFWTWGAEQSYAADPLKYEAVARPYIELWAGNSHEFFMDAQMTAGEEKAWVESYMPTVGLSKITNANKHAAASLGCIADQNLKTISFNMDVFTTHPDEQMKAVFKLKGSNNYDLGESKFTGDPVKANKLTISTPMDKIAAGKYTYSVEVLSSSGESLFQAEMPFETNSKGEIAVNDTAAPAVSKDPFSFSMPAIAGIISLVIIIAIILVLKKRS